jgi:hypothetical protein
MEMLTLVAAGLADASMTIRVHEAISSDPELAARFSFLQALAGNESNDFPSCLDPHVHPMDSHLGVRLKAAVDGQDEAQIASAFQDLLRFYGGHALALVDKSFPGKSVNIGQLLKAVLIRAGSMVHKLDETRESVRTWFLRMVFIEAIAVLKQQTTEEFQRREKQILARTAGAKGFVSVR